MDFFIRIIAYERMRSLLNLKYIFSVQASGFLLLFLIKVSAFELTFIVEC